MKPTWEHNNRSCRNFCIDARAVYGPFNTDI